MDGALARSFVVIQCECGNEIDRDYQASLNLKNYGEKLLQST